MRKRYALTIRRCCGEAHRFIELSPDGRLELAGFHRLFDLECDPATEAQALELRRVGFLPRSGSLGACDVCLRYHWPQLDRSACTYRAGRYTCGYCEED